MSVSQADKAKRLRALHEAPGAFVIPNPWDAGSARVLEAMGFQALATSSGACAGVLGRRDGKVSREPEEERGEDRAGVPVEHPRREHPHGQMLTSLREEERPLCACEESQRRPDAEDDEGVECGAACERQRPALFRTE